MALNIISSTVSFSNVPDSTCELPYTECRRPRGPAGAEAVLYHHVDVLIGSADRRFAQRA